MFNSVVQPSTPSTPAASANEKAKSLTVEVKKETVDEVLKDTEKTTLEVDAKMNETVSIVKLGADSMAALADRKVNLYRTGFETSKTCFYYIDITYDL